MRIKRLKHFEQRPQVQRNYAREVDKLDHIKPTLAAFDVRHEWLVTAQSPGDFRLGHATSATRLNHALDNEAIARGMDRLAHCSRPVDVGPSTNPEIGLSKNQIFRSGSHARMTARLALATLVVATLASGCADRGPTYDDPAVAVCELLLTNDEKVSKPGYKRVSSTVSGMAAIIRYETSPLNTAPAEREGICTFAKNNRGLYEVTSIDDPVVAACIVLLASINDQTIIKPSNEEERIDLSDRLRTCATVSKGFKTFANASVLRPAIDSELYPIDPSRTQLDY